MRVFAILPAYNEAQHIAGVIARVPPFIERIIVVDDASTDNTAEVVRGLSDPRIDVIREEKNQGVGGAVLDGYRRAMELGCDVAVKIDADGQMDPGKVARLIAPILSGRADYTKGFRFHDPETLRKMPRVRVLGNVGLSFLAKSASGYWNIFDPANGFTALHRAALERLNLSRIHRDYFFETDMLANLYLVGAVVRDVYLPTHYGDETSHLSAARVLFTFPWRLLRCFARRISWRYFIGDFSAVSLLLTVGSPLVLFGTIFGLTVWIRNASAGIITPTGTVILAALPFILGFQMLLQALVIDVGNVPKEPLQGQEVPPPRS
jgi:dolichol-phosphate mannosyltransferase